MSEAEEKIAKLRRVVEAGLYRLNQDGSLNSRYVSEIVVPPLRDVLVDLSIEIEKSHRFYDGEEGERNFVIHYTSVSTLISILHNASKGRKTSLRLYDSAHFNDPDEGNYLGRILREKYGWMSSDNPTHAYITSFITPYDSDGKKKNMSDNLVFWRTYGRDGEGCSLKLSVRSCRLRKVLYGPDGARCAGMTLSPILDMLSPLAEVDKDIGGILAEAIWQPLGRIRYLYKSEAYDYENECRFVILGEDVSEDNICFDYNEQRYAHVRVRHYCEHKDLEISEKALISGSSITLGPCIPNVDDLCRSFEILRQRANFEGLRIGKSNISYRPS